MSNIVTNTELQLRYNNMVIHSQLRFEFRYELRDTVLDNNFILQSNKKLKK